MKNLSWYEGSIFGAGFDISGVFFAPLGGILAGWIGRRKTIFLTSPIVAIGYLVIALSENKIMLFIGRFVSTGALFLHLPAEGIHYTFNQITKVWCKKNYQNLDENFILQKSCSILFKLWKKTRTLGRQIPPNANCTFSIPRTAISKQFLNNCKIIMYNLNI